MNVLYIFCRLWHAICGVEADYRVEYRWRLVTVSLTKPVHTSAKRVLIGLRCLRMAVAEFSPPSASAAPKTLAKQLVDPAGVERHKDVALSSICDRIGHGASCLS